MGRHEEMDDVVLVSPRLVLVGCDVQYLHATFQCYEEVPMGGNPTVWKIVETFLVGIMEASMVGEICSLSTGGRPGAWILAVLI